MIKRLKEGNGIDPELRLCFGVFLLAVVVHVIHLLQNLDLKMGYDDSSSDTLGDFHAH